MFTLAIIGRPNVGKSTLFNRLTGKQHAIVDDMPGVTRDRREGMGRIGPLECMVIDTAGMEEAKEEALESRMLEQTERAIEQANMVLMLIDGRVGVTPVDEHFADKIRRSGKPVALVVNKCEGKQALAAVHESYSLGLGEPVCISAAHGEGLVNLYDAVAPLYEKYQEEEQALEEGEKAIQIAIVGRPNAGKSTLMNALLGTDRMLTGPEAGITRDAIAIHWDYKGIPIRLVDTAGMRKKSQVHSKLEKLAVDDAERAIRYAQVVIMLMDAACVLESQDLAIANRIIEEGRALVIAINKWDLVKDKPAMLDAIHKKIEKSLPHVKGVPVICLSALHKQHIYTAIEKALSTYKVWEKHISTAKLNSWLKEALERHPLPVTSLGRRVRIKYITQYKKRPPAFLLFTSQPEEVPESYVRYLMHDLRETFNLPGIPLRMVLRKGENPYEGRKKKKAK